MKILARHDNDYKRSEHLWNVQYKKLKGVPKLHELKVSMIFIEIGKIDQIMWLTQLTIFVKLENFEFHKIFACTFSTILQAFCNLSYDYQRLEYLRNIQYNLKSLECGEIARNCVFNGFYRNWQIDQKAWLITHNFHKKWKFWVSQDLLHEHYIKLYKPFESNLTIYCAHKFFFYEFSTSKI